MDEDAPEYRALHPNKQKSKSSLVAEHFDLVSDGEEERSAESGDDSDAGSSSSDEEERVSSKNKRQRVSETPDVSGKKRKGSEPRLASNHFHDMREISFLHQQNLSRDCLNVYSHRFPVDLRVHICVHCCCPWKAVRGER